MSRKLTAIAVLTAATMAIAVALSACGSSTGASRESGTLRVTYASFPELPRPGARLRHRKLYGALQHLRATAHLRARQRRGRERGDPGAGQGRCRRSATTAAPTRSSSAPGSSTPTAPRCAPPTSPASVERMLRAELRRLALLHRHRRRRTLRSKPSAAGSPASRPTTRAARSSSTWSSRAAPSPTSWRCCSSRRCRRTRRPEPDRQPAAGDRPLRDHQLRAGPGLGIRAQPAMGEEQREADAATCPAATSTRSTSRSSATRRPRSTTSSRASSTGWRTRRRPTATPK